MMIRDCYSNEIHGEHDYRIIGVDCHCNGYDGTCRNCSGRKCMSCVLREQHEQCRDDCPVCSPHRIPQDWGMRMQSAAAAHLDAVWAASEGKSDEVEDPADAAFDGCDICCIRETLAGAWPIIDEYAEFRVREALRDHRN